jgi:hypothetical protein
MQPRQRLVEPSLVIDLGELAAGVTVATERRKEEKKIG